MMIVDDQNTQKEADIPHGNEKKNDELVIEIREMVERREIESSKQCRIYKIPNPLRKWNEEAYTPQVVSIGPFHHKNERLKAMEEHKERYFRSLAKRSKVNLENLVRTIREMEESIRGCYELTIDLTSDSFVKMILVDACFILELFFRCCSGSWTSDDPMFVKPRDNLLLLDLLLLENQLPFFVIEKLHNLVPSSSYYNNLLELSFHYFGYYNIQRMKAHPNVNIEHFTDLIRTFQLPPAQKLPERHTQVIQHLYSVAELHGAGLKFKVGESNCYFDIKLEKGVLEIPKFEIDTKKEVVARNIMALEQTRYVKEAYYSDYFVLLDLLINTRKDVDLLCNEKILVNYLGDNDAATSMINNLNKSVIWNGTRVDYIDLCKELNDFYENPCHRRKATLKSQYFSTPWKSASTVAAIILLVLTFIQTICNIIPLV